VTDVQATLLEPLPELRRIPPALDEYLWFRPSPASGARRPARTRSRLAVSPAPTSRRVPVELPCQVNDPDLWFADAPAELEFAKALCGDCPARQMCLVGAIERREPCGVWGGQIFDDGRIVPFKRRRGRPRKDATSPARSLAG
jgi:WhiB family redox-sensing transcriptional regulator